MNRATRETLTSTKNPLIVMLRSLKSRKGRKETGMLLIEGEKLLIEAMALGLAPGFLLYDEARPLDDALILRFVERGAEVHATTGHVLGVVCDTKEPQGCAAAFALPESMDVYPDRLVALDGVQDPGNVGTIWRTADASGFQGVLIGEGSADPYSPKVQRAAMGSGIRLKCACVDLYEALSRLKAEGYEIVASTLDGTPFYARGPIADRFVLVIGNEARGISDPVASLADKKLKLPMRGGAESLNAAVAAGIMMYELTR